MTGLRSLAAILFAAASAMGMSADFAAPARPEPANLRWRTGIVRIAVSSSLVSQNSSLKADSDVLGAIRRSFAAWEAVTGLEFRIEISDKQSVSPSGTAGDGVSLITIAQTPENLQLFAKDPFAESARTRVFYNRRGAITEGDIVLDPFQQFSTDGTYGTFDLETTLTHEIGHLLGLKHSQVLGSIMTPQIPRNGDAYVGPRTLSASDVAAVRDLYAMSSDTCCGAITGRLTGMPKGTRVVVWAEDRDARVVGQAEVSSDGSYRMGGLAPGKVQVFWSVNGGSTADLGSATVENDIPTALSKRISLEKNGFSLDYVGLNMQPSDSAIYVKPGRQYSVCLAGAGFGSGPISLSSGSRYIRFDNSSVTRTDLGDRIDALTASIVVDPDTPAGTYTLYAERADGTKAAIIGGIVVSR